MRIDHAHQIRTVLFLLFNTREIDSHVSTSLHRRAARPSDLLTDAGKPTRKPTNLTLTVALVAEAKELGVNLSQAAELGIAAAVARRRQDRWLAENKEALDSSNTFVEEHGLPLALYRRF